MHQFETRAYDLSNIELCFEISRGKFADAQYIATAGLEGAVQYANAMADSLHWTSYRKATQRGDDTKWINEFAQNAMKQAEIAVAVGSHFVVLSFDNGNRMLALMDLIGEAGAEPRRAHQQFSAYTGRLPGMTDDEVRLADAL